MACSLINLHNAEMLRTHYLYGALFENMVIEETIKYTSHQGIHPKIYYWRESNGTEIDCIIEKDPDKVTALEIKGGQTFNKDHLKNLNRFSSYSKKLEVEKFLIYTGEEKTKIGDTNIFPWQSFPGELNDIIKQ